MRKKIELITDKHTLVLGLRGDRNFIITELIDRRNKKRLESMQTGVADALTDETLARKPLSSSQQSRESDKTFGDALFTDKRPLFNLDNPYSTTNAIHLQDSASSKLAYNQNIKALEVFYLAIITKQTPI